MGTGYIRKDTTNNISDGNVINSADLDNEFDGVVDAFNAATGHDHGGDPANGAPITKVGPAQDVVISSSAVAPKIDDTVDLGSATFEFKDLYIDGTANIDSLVADTADINGGTVDGAAIGSASASTGAFTTLSSTSTTTLNGTTIPASATLVRTADKLNALAATTSAELAGVISDETGTGSLVFANSPTLVTPALGTPSSVTLTNATGLPVSTGISGLGSGIATFLATPSSFNLASAVTNETGSGSLVFATSPTLVTPALGTPSSVTLTNATGLPTAGLVDNAVTDAKLRDSAALSVIGRSSNTSGDPADIAAASDHQVLRRSGTAVGFGSVALNQTNAVTGTLPVGNGGTGRSTLAVNNVILGNDASTVQLVAPGTSGNGLFSDGTTWASRAAIVSATSQATTSGANKDFTGIPSWVKRIIVMFNGVSTNGNTNILIQLGDSGGFETTGYVSNSVEVTGGSATDDEASTAGFILFAVASNILYGNVEITNFDGNTWTSSHSLRSLSSKAIVGGGVKTLSDPLTQLRITGNGSNFDAGSVNIIYQ